MSGIDMKVCLSILDRALRNSGYFLSSGRSAGAYANIDGAMLGYRNEKEVVQPQHHIMEDMAQQFTKKIALIDNETPFDRLAFIDKAGRGPVGMIALSSLIVFMSQKEAIFVRPYKNSIRALIEGRQLGVNEKILIVSDIATTGETIIKAASKLWRSEATVVGSVVFFDQELGAKENLALKDIKLHSLCSKTNARNLENAETKLPDLRIGQLSAFGGLM